MEYRRKPERLHAVRWDGQNAAAVADLVGAGYTVEHDPRRNALVLYAGGEGWSVGMINLGRWVVKDADGRLRVISDERFRGMCEEVVECPDGPVAAS